MNNKDNNHSPEKYDLIGLYSNHLIFLWGQYIKIIQLILVLSGATIAIVINVVFMNKTKDNSIESPEIAIYSIVIALIAGFLAMGWRWAAQILMEKQVYGDKEDAVKYFEITETRAPLALRLKSSKKLELILEILKYTAGPTLVLSWIVLIYFFKVNVF